MTKFVFGCLLGLFLTTSLFGQVITDVPPNEPNSRFLNDSPVISMRPGLSVAGFSNDGTHGWGLQQILNQAMESENSSAFESVSRILDKAKESISLNPPTGQITATTNILQYRAFEALASLTLEQNGVSSGESNNTYGLTIRDHSSLINELTNALTTLTANNKLVQKKPGNQPFDDYLDAIRSYNNMARAIDLYLAIENAYSYFGLDESPLLSQQEKLDLMSRFRTDINILFNDGVKKSYDLGDVISVTEDVLEAGNRPLKGYLTIAYASMSAQTITQEEQDLLDNYISTTMRKASETSDNQRGRYWMYQTANGSRFWAEGPFYFDFVLKDAIAFWHAIRINQELDDSFDPFFNDWFLNPVRWLADLSTPDGFLPPLDDSNKRAIQSASFLRWSDEYGNKEVGQTFTTIYENLQDYHSESLFEDQFYLIEAAIPRNESGGAEIESLTNEEEQQFVIRYTDESNQQHYLSFVGEKNKSITSGEGHEQPDQLQLLYYMDEYSFLTDGGYDNGSPQQNSSWNGYLFTNTMQYNASDIQRTLDFVTYQNQGGLESPFASIVETRKISVHNEAEILHESPAPNVSFLSGRVDLNFESPTQSSSTYNRSVLFVKGENPYLIDINDISVHSGRNDFVMRYYGNSDQTNTENGWFSWESTDRPFTSPTHQLYLYTLPLTGSFTEENKTVQIQELQHRFDGEKQPYPVIRKSYISNEESNRFTTASILNIRENAPSSKPEFVSNAGDLSYLTYQVDSETVDLFVFAADSSENKQSLSIQSGPLNGVDFSLQANEVIGFSRLRMDNDSWKQDSDYSVHLQSSTAPNPTETPHEFKLFNPFPNPMQETGNVQYQLAEESEVTLQLFDLLGREVKLLFQGTQSADMYTAEWESDGIAAGVYILRLTATANSGSTFQKSVMVSVIK